MNLDTPSRPTPTSEFPALDARRPLVPNAETIEAIEEARRGELLYVDSIEELRAVLDSDYEEDDDLAESPRSRPAPACG